VNLTEVQMHRFYRPLSSNYKFHISFKSTENKTGEKQFNLNLSKNKPCTFIHKYATILSQKVQKCNVISLDIKLLKVTCLDHLIARGNFDLETCLLGIRVFT
jgi:hypothetical protein